MRALLFAPILVLQSLSTFPQDGNFVTEGGERVRGAKDSLPGLNGEALRVRHETFRKYLTLTGQLAARDSTIVTVPRDSSLWSFIVTDLVPEGNQVEPGDLLVRFDSTELAKRALELEKSKEDTRIQIAQTKAQQEARLQDLRLAVATAQKNLNVANLYVGIDRSLIPASEAERYEFDFSKSKVELDKATERLAGHDAATAAELAVNELDFKRAEIGLEKVRNELGRMTIRAPNPGTVIHGLNLEGRKIEVGDSLFKESQVVLLPDMSSVTVRATTFDGDFALLQLGAPATVTFDAYPEREFAGSILELPEVAKPKNRNSELNLFTVEILLHEVDLSIMKPGMTARVEIPVDTPESIVIPRRSLAFEEDGGSYVVSAKTPDQHVPVEVVDSNSYQLSIRGELADGDILLDQQSLRSHSSRPELEWIDVNRENLKFTVSATGVLKAAGSVAITPPAIRNTWRFKIIRMTPEGTEVEAGDPVVAFDPSEQLQLFQQEEANLKKVEEELEKVRASQILSERDLELELEEALVQLERAENKLGQAQQFDSGLKILEAGQEQILARSKVDLLTKKLESIREHSRLQSKILEETAALHASRIETAREAIDRLQVSAPQDGVVIYKRDWNNRKKQVGSDARMNEIVLSLPDLSSLIINGQVAEVDAGKVQVGQRVEISLDSMPDRTLSGRVAEVGKIYVQPSRDRPLRVLNIEVHFDEVDASRMGPEMIARLDIVIDHYRDVLSLPLSVIQIQGERSFVWVQRNSEILRQEIQLGENNGVVAVVTEGLHPGDKVSTSTPDGRLQ